jgi:tRNA A-37 threonylcarbamoyl transferase component Bud32
MTTERWRQIESIFEAISQAPLGKRAALLDEACGGDLELRQEMESLLACDSDDEAFLSTPVEGAAEQVARSQIAANIGKRIGAWRITGVIGKGGMGAVYRAVRDDGQYDKEAALKLLRHGLDSETDLRRFRRERQILARLEHPNIARLLDGGTSDEGLPYLVMEYVDGIPITDYCRQGLSIHDRLRLFRRICSAVQYAHQSLVVHRDLKPANILVTSDGTPKLLDFGIAKLLNPETESGDIPTFTTAWLLTPDYASPEQILGKSITVSSDIYSLGAILFELLTGRRPHDVKGRSAGEIERTICEQEIARPSTIAGSRHLRGDLDNILLMAMRKEAGRRYSSVEQFSEDIRRHLEGLPVLARKDTALYRTGKFLRRNRWPIAVGAVAAAALIVTTAIAVFQARRAQQQFTVARDLATTMLIDVNEKVRMLPGSVEARSTMVKKGLPYLESISKEAGDPAVLWDLARGYERIAALQASPEPAEPNLHDRASGLESYRRALSFARAVEADRRSDPEFLLVLCRIHLGIGAHAPDSEEARRHLEEAMRLASMLPSNTPKIFGPNGPETGEYLRTLGLLFIGWRTVLVDPASALEVWNKMWTPVQHSSLMYAYDALGDIDRTLAAAVDCARFLRNLQAGYPLENIRKRVMRLSEARAELMSGRVLGSPFHMSFGETTLAEAACRRALRITDEALTHDSSDEGFKTFRLLVLTILAAVRSVRLPAEAVDIYKEVLSSSTYPGLADAQGLQQGLIQDARWQITYPLRKLGRKQEALDQALASIRERPAVGAHLAAGDAELDIGTRDAALEQYRKALGIAEKRATGAPKNMRWRFELAQVYDHLGRYYESTHEWESAWNWYSKAHAVWAKWTEAGGVSNRFVIRSERETAQAVARCAAQKNP